MKKLEMVWMPEWADPLPETELKEIERLCELTEKKIFVDVGCLIGGFTKVMAKVARNNNGKVFSIDLFKTSPAPTVLWEIHHSYPVKDIFIRHMAERGVSEYVNILEGDASSFVPQFEDESVDFIFLDAAHNFNSVTNDLTLWYKKLKKGGVIAGHDYEDKTYDSRYVLEDGHGDRHHGVIKAVNEFFDSRGLIFKPGKWSCRIWSHQKS